MSNKLTFLFKFYLNLVSGSSPLSSLLIFDKCLKTIRRARRKIVIKEIYVKWRSELLAKYMPPLKLSISGKIVKSRITGTKNNRMIEGTAITEESEIFLNSAKSVKKITQPKTNIIGEINKIYPAKQETAFPPLKL